MAGRLGGGAVPLVGQIDLEGALAAKGDVLGGRVGCGGRCTRLLETALHGGNRDGCRLSPSLLSAMFHPPSFLVAAAAAAAFPALAVPEVPVPFSAVRRLIAPGRRHRCSFSPRKSPTDRSKAVPTSASLRSSTPSSAKGPSSPSARTQSVLVVFRLIARDQSPGPHTPAQLLPRRRPSSRPRPRRRAGVRPQRQTRVGAHAG